jgi:hypothetical protein
MLNDLTFLWNSIYDNTIVRIYIYFFKFCGGTLGTAATTDLLYQPRLIGEGDCGEIGGMKMGRENRTSRRKPAPASLCPPQIAHDLTRVLTRVAAAGSQRLTAWAMARPLYEYYFVYLNYLNDHFTKWYELTSTFIIKALLRDFNYTLYDTSVTWIL